MLAARASRAAQHISRTYATVSDISGIRVASVDHNQPTSAITVLVKAGSRYEHKKGVAHALKNFAFKSTAKRSALGTVRESELYGGILSASLSREHLAFTAEFMRGDEAFFSDVLTSFLTSAKFSRHEFEEYVSPLIQGDIESAYADPAIRAVDIAHTIAFRSGLGSSLFAPQKNSITVEDIKSFAAASFTKGNVAVLGSGISQSVLAKLTESSLGSAPAGSTVASTSSYFGGETRVNGIGGPQTVFIGFGTIGAPSSQLATVAAHLSTSPSIKWSVGLSPIATTVPKNASVQTIYLPYSDASLFGFLIQGSTVDAVKEAGKCAISALQTAAKGITEEEFQKAAAKAKFSAASAFESRDGLVSTLASKVLAGSDASVDAAISSIDKVDAASFSKAASSLIKTKPTYVVVGDVHALPYSDDLGL